MPTARQQRAPRNRRVPYLSQPAKVAQVALTITEQTTNRIVLTASVQSQPPDGDTTPKALQLHGIPQVYATVLGAMPSAATISPDGVTLTLTYPTADLDPSEVYAIGPYDPALRTPQGGWAAPAILRLPLVDAPYIPWTITAGEGFATVNLDAPPGGYTTIFDPRLLLHVESGEYPAFITQASPTQFGVNWPSGGQTFGTALYSAPNIVTNTRNIAQPNRGAHPFSL